MFNSVLDLCVSVSVSGKPDREITWGRRARRDCKHSVLVCLKFVFISITYRTSPKTIWLYLTSTQHLLYNEASYDIEKKFLVCANQLDCFVYQCMCLCTACMFAGAFITSEWFYHHHHHQRIVYSVHSCIL